MGAVGAAVGLGARLVFPSAFAGLSTWLTAVVLVGLPFALAGLYTSFVALAIDRYEVSISLPAIQAVLVLAFAVPAAVGFGLRGARRRNDARHHRGRSRVRGLGSAKTCARRAFRARPAPACDVLRNQGLRSQCAPARRYRLDLFVLSAVASTAAVGNYSLAVALTSLLWLLPGALSAVLFPRVARLSHGDEESAREMVETKSLRHVSLVTILSTLLLAAGLVVLVVPLFGDGFQPAINLGLDPVARNRGYRNLGRPGRHSSRARQARLCPLRRAGRHPVHGRSVRDADPVARGERRSTRVDAVVLRDVSPLVRALSADNGAARVPLLVPTRSELDDLWALPRATAAWVRQRG